MEEKKIMVTEKKKRGAEEGRGEEKKEGNFLKSERRVSQ